MSKNNKKPAWSGHSSTIALMCGCSTTTVSKILNGRETEVTNNQELIKRIKKAAADLIQRDAIILINAAEEKQKIAAALVA